MMADIDQWTITQAVLRAQQGCTNPRLKTILDSLVTHLHDFAREVQLSESEWHAGIEFLTEVGRFTDHRRQEFILLSDTLGLSTLVTAQNNRKPEDCTQSTVLGPLFVDNAPRYDNGDDIANGARGEPCFVTGQRRRRRSHRGRPRCDMAIGAVLAVANPYWNPRPLEHAAMVRLLRRAYEGLPPQID
jgi:hydroxyquinol 1,2-dioxygenase